MTTPAHRWGILNDSMIAGAGAGFVASVATCPLDVVKTKLQAQVSIRGHHEYLGPLDIVKSVLKRDGIKGMYRGLGPTLLGYLPTWAIYFSVYDGIKSRLAGEDDAAEATLKNRLYPAPHAKGFQPVAREHAWGTHLFSAMVAGACSTVATNPFWVIKTRFMTQAPDERRYRHTYDAVATIYRAEGIRAFYRGLLPSLLGIAHVAVQFPLYEQLKIWAAHPDGTPPTSGAILACSGASKMVASLTTYPHEVIRTRLQIQRRELAAHPDAPRPPGLVGTFRDVVRSEGWRGLYKGLSVNLFRTVPNSAVTMLTYELVMRYLHRT